MRLPKCHSPWHFVFLKQSNRIMSNLVVLNLQTTPMYSVGSVSSRNLRRKSLPQGMCSPYHDVLFVVIVYLYLAPLSQNPDAKRTRLLMPVLQAARRTILLTGTPALSRPLEIFTQLHAISPRLFYSLKKFSERYCETPNNLNELYKKIQPLMLRRFKSKVLSLPPRLRKVQHVKVAQRKKSEDVPLVQSEALSESETLISSLISGADQLSGTAAALSRIMQMYRDTGESKLPVLSGILCLRAIFLSVC